MKKENFVDYSNLEPTLSGGFESQDDDKSLLEYFNSRILEDERFGSSGEWNRERTTAANMMYALVNFDYDDALLNLACLFLWKKSGRETSNYDSEYDTLDLIWTSLRYFSTEIDELDTLFEFYKSAGIKNGLGSFLVAIMFLCVGYASEERDVSMKPIQQQYLDNFPDAGST